MKIKSLLRLSFGGMIGVLVSISALGIYSSLHQVKVIDDVLEHPYQVSALSREILSEILKIRQRMKDLPFLRTEAERAELSREVSDIEKDSLEDFGKLETLYRGDPADVRNFRQHFLEWKDFRNDIFALYRKGRGQEATHLIRTRGQQEVDHLEKEAETVFSRAEGRARELVERSRAAQKRATHFLIFLCVLGFGAALLTVFQLTWRVLLPLNGIAWFAGRIADGDYSRRIPPGRPDEIGQVAGALNQMAMKIESHNRELLNLNEQLEVKVQERTAELLSTNQQLHASEQQLRATNQQLKASDQQLRAAVQQLRASDQQLRASEQQLRAANQQLKASGEELREKVLELQEYSSEQEGLGTLSRVLEGGAIEDACHAAILALEKHWLHLRVIGIKVTYEEHEHRSHKYFESPWTLSCDLKVGPRIAGNILVHFDPASDSQIAGFREAKNTQRLERFSTRLGELFLVLEERKRAEMSQQQLLVASKFSAIGELSAGVGHEINNPLAVIYAYLEIFLESCPSKCPEQVESFMKIQSAAGRIRKIVDGLRTFARTDQEKTEPVQINRAIRDCVALVEGLYEREGIVFDLRLSEGPLTTQGNTGKLQQVFINLFSNAKDALSGVRPGIIRVQTEHDDDKCVILITDNGCGMSEDVQARLFSPFFTTKEIGKGTGLGLGICLSIIKEMKGRISVDSKPGKGTEFRLELPESLESAEVIPFRSEHPSLSRLKGCVLVVEDEEEIRKVLVKNLLKRGLLVEGVADGEEALEKLHKTTYDVVITDLKMKTMDGGQLIRRMKEMGRKEKVILMSGAIEMETGTLQNSVDAVVRKPFLITELLEILRAQMAPA